MSHRKRRDRQGMAPVFNDRPSPLQRERLGNLLREHLILEDWRPRWGGEEERRWGPLGQVTLQGGRRVSGGDVRARLTKRRNVPLEVGVEYWKNGIHAEVTRTPDGRFGGSISKTYRF